MEVSDLPKDKKIILFDGVCNLCDASVQFILKHDKNDYYRFVPLQSDLGQKIQNYLGIAHKNIKSIILYEPGKAYYYKAKAVLQIAEELGGFFSFFNLFSLMPAFVSNWLYDYVAKNRYRWYGKKEICMIPTKKLKENFYF